MLWTWKNVGGLKNVWEVCQQILGKDLKKKFGGGGGYAQIFHRLEKCWGGGMPTNLWTWKMFGGVMPKYYRDLKKNVGGGGGYAQIF